MRYPKVLIISNNCFSQSGSNGRTLANFFIGWPKKNIAQFYIQNEIPDNEVCEKYYRITDKQALKGVIKRNNIGEEIKLNINKDNSEEKVSALQSNKRYKNALTSILRNTIWSITNWNNKEFNQWIDEFNPQIILLQAGDSPFMLKIAEKISIIKSIPIIIYNSEDYYFKKINYFDDKRFNFLYPLFIKSLRNEYVKIMSKVKYCIYNTPELEQVYLKEFEHKSGVIMTSTTLDMKKERNNNQCENIAYLGNLGVGRHQPLIEIAKVLQEIDKNLYLKVYGPIKDTAVKNDIDSCEGIKYQGEISYSKVIEVMKESDILIHAENSNKFYEEDLKHAFSTKIADSLASKTCFLLYAPKSLACTKYLKENQIAHVASTLEELKNMLDIIISSAEIRNKYIEKALKKVEENHNVDKNVEKMRQIIDESIGGI